MPRMADDHIGVISCGWGRPRQTAVPTPITIRVVARNAKLVGGSGGRRRLSFAILKPALSSPPARPREGRRYPETADTR